MQRVSCCSIISFGSTIDSDCKDLSPSRNRSPIYRALVALDVGEALFIEKKEWKKTYSPTQISRRIAKKYNRKYKGGRDAKDRGWAIQRVS